LTFGAMAESSPSIRPLSVTMLSGTGGAVKNVRQTKTPAAASTTSPRSGMILRRPRLWDRTPAASAGGACKGGWVTSCAVMSASVPARIMPRVHAPT